MVTTPYKMTVNMCFTELMCSDALPHITSIDPLHVTSHFGHFCIHPFGCCHVGGQKCIAVIERKALNVSLFTNASDYSNKTCMERSMCLYLTNIVVLLE